MSGRYAKLKQGWMLRGWSNEPWMLVNWLNSDQRQLKAMGFYVAESCDGRTDFDSPAFLGRHHAMLELLIAEGIVEECPEQAVIEPWQRYRKADNPRLTAIHWCVTGRCNLECRYCYMEAPSERYGELPFATMARLIEQFERANVFEVSLTGGEPFLRQDFMDIVQLLAEKKIRLSQIYSNGLLITDSHLEDLRETGFSPVFQISYDGVGSHDRMRGARGTEPRVIESIRRLRAAGFSVVVATAIDKSNIANLADTYKLMKMLEVEAWRIAAPQAMGNWRGVDTAASLEEQADACTPLLDRWIKDGQPFSIQLGGFYRGNRPRKPGATHTGRRSRRNAMDPHRWADMSESPVFLREGYDCGTCREQPNLLPDGTLVPCPGYVGSILHGRMPNLLCEDLSKAWTRSSLREIADLKKQDLLDRNAECATCQSFEECGIGCRASALMNTGNLMEKDPIACEIFRKGYKNLFRKMVVARTQEAFC